MSAVGSILTNQGALGALQAISNTSTLNNTLEGELSSGLSVSSPASNPSGYISAQGFTSQLNGLTQAISNANQGVSLLQTAQGALQQQIGVGQQLNSIAVQAANGTETSQEAGSLQSVVTQLVGQISSISSQTQFNNVNLLDGSFNNVQFQVGSNEGQTLNLSIANTSASALGAYQTQAQASVISAGAASAAALAGNYNATAGSGAQISVGGTSLGTVTPTSTTESAASLASQINSLAGAQGVTATASNVVALGKVTGGSANSALTLTLAASGSGKTIGSTFQATGSSTTTLAASINKGTENTGISATVNSSGNLLLTQATGQNIQLSGFSQTGTAAFGSGNGATLATGNYYSIQGGVQVAAASQVTVGNATGGAAVDNIGGTSTFQSLANVNVSTVNGATPNPAGGTFTNAATYGGALNAQGGANQAINIVKYSLDSLNNAGGQLGAVQQGLTANINNLNTTSQNVTGALGVVQDANLPQVANQLTQAQIQAQAGVAALKSSTTLQQSYLSLLP